MARGKQHLKREGTGRPRPPRAAPPARAGAISPRETRVMVVGGLLALGAFMLATLAQSDVVPATAAGVVALVVGVGVIAVSLRAWLGTGNHWLDRERLPVAAPIALAGGAVAAALGVLLEPVVGLIISVGVALASAALLGIALGGRRRRGQPPA